MSTTTSSYIPSTFLDEKDERILESRCTALDSLPGPRVGDYVRFTDGTERRISFVTPEEWLPEVDSVQTSDGGSWYLGDGYVNFSGSLHPGVSRETLTLTDEERIGTAWFFHHDHWQADNGITVGVTWRVYESSEPATA